MLVLARTVAFILASMTLSATVKAEDFKWRRVLFEGKFDAESRDARSAIARGMFDQIIELRAFVPSLTADQKSRLKSERASIDTLGGEAKNEKMASLATSRKFYQETLTYGIDNLLSALKCAKRSEISLTQELGCWSYAIWEMTDSDGYNDAINTLHREGVVTFSKGVRKQFGLDYAEDQPWGGYHFYGRLIQKEIVLPLIRQLEK